MASSVEMCENAVCFSYRLPSVQISRECLSKNLERKHYKVKLKKQKLFQPSFKKSGDAFFVLFLSDIVNVCMVRAVD